MKFKLVLITFLMVGSSVACGSLFKKDEPLPTVPNVSLKRYIGKWYAITSLPQFFTRGCVAQTAVYGLNSSSEISVLNTCIKDSGEATSIKGFAKTTSVPGVLELEFTGGFPGFFGITSDYNIIKLDPDYKYALIGGRDRKSLWFLSRTKNISDQIYNTYTVRAHELGYDVTKLKDSKF